MLWFMVHVMLLHHWGNLRCRCDVNASITAGWGLKKNWECECKCESIPYFGPKLAIKIKAKDMVNAKALCWYALMFMLGICFLTFSRTSPLGSTVHNCTTPQVDTYLLSKVENVKCHSSILFFPPSAFILLPSLPFTFFFGALSHSSSSYLDGDERRGRPLHLSDSVYCSSIWSRRCAK